MESARLGLILRPLHLALLAAVLLLTACGGPAKPPEPIAPPAPAVRSALARLSALQRIPADAFFVAAADDLAALQSKLGWVDFMAAVGPYAGEITAEIVKEIGYDILDHSQLRRFGIDPTGEIGLVVMDPDASVAVVFIALSDPAVFKSKFGTLFGGAHSAKGSDAVETRSVGDTTILSLPGHGGPSVLVRDSVALAVVGSGATREEVTQKIIGLAPGASLADLPAFQSAIERLDYGSDIGFYVNTQPVTDGIVAEASGSRHRPSSRTPSPRQTKAAQKARTLVEGIGPLAAGVEFADGEVGLRVALDASKASWVQRLLKTVTSPPAVVTASTTQPLSLLGLSIEPSQAWLLAKFLVAGTREERELATAETVIRAFVGSGVDELLAMLSGEVGSVVTVDLAGIEHATRETFPGRFGGSLTIGVTNPQTVQALLDTLANHPLEGGRIQKAAGQYLIAVPEWHAVRIALSGDQLVVSTSEEFINNEAAVDASPSFAAAAKPALREILVSDDWTVMAAFDWPSIVDLVEVRERHEGKRPSSAKTAGFDVIRDLGVLGLRAHLTDDALVVDAVDSLAVNSLGAVAGRLVRRYFDLRAASSPASASAP